MPLLSHSPPRDHEVQNESYRPQTHSLGSWYSQYFVVRWGGRHCSVRIRMGVGTTLVALSPVRKI